jgi:DnaK suppressor protein
MTITSNDVAKFQEILEAKEAELVEGPRRRTDIAIERSPDQMDEVQHAAEREVAIQNLDRESDMLRDVRAALGRIHDGTFGTCLHCESEIASKRLAAVPWASFCIQCQNAAAGDAFDTTAPGGVLEDAA